MSLFGDKYNGDRMKKMLYFILIIIVLFIQYYKISDTNAKEIINDDSNINYTYYLDFNNEILSTNNLKLKLSLFFNDNSVIIKYYPKYNTDLKEYFSYDKEKIDSFKNDYLNLLRNDNRYDEINKTMETGVIIKGIEVYTTMNSINNYLKKYPNIKYIRK